MLICEGWTDYVYIENALRQLVSDYPSLVSSGNNEKATFAIKRFKNSKSHTSEIIGIKGGFGDFKHFIQFYKSEFDRLSKPVMKEPVILLIDNDRAAKEIMNVVNNMYKKDNNKKNKNESYIHICHNLYLILTPLQENQHESTIEDLFDTVTLNTKINGKSFNRSNDQATETTYGKAVFARKVVEERATSINFEGFVPLLDRIAMVIENHYAQIKK